MIRGQEVKGCIQSIFFMSQHTENDIVLIPNNKADILTHTHTHTHTHICTSHSHSALKPQSEHRLSVNETESKAADRGASLLPFPPTARSLAGR